MRTMLERMPSPRWLVATVMTMGVLLPLAARGADRIEAKERKAHVECSAGNYTEGVRLLAELWVASSDTTYIYNQGRCYEQNGQNEQAVSRFREYLRKTKKLPAVDSAEINRRIAELERQASKQVGPPQTVINLVQPAASQPAAVPPAAPAPVDRTAELVSAPRPAPEGDSPVYKRWWFWTGIGAVVVGGAVTAVLLSRSTKSPGCDTGVPCVP
jgi:hypothetical protein